MYILQHKTNSIDLNFHINLNVDVKIITEKKIMIEKIKSLFQNR